MKRQKPYPFVAANTHPSTSLRVTNYSVIPGTAGRLDMTRSKRHPESTAAESKGEILLQSKSCFDKLSMTGVLCHPVPIIIGMSKDD
jgi:hypothetical protein